MKSVFYGVPVATTVLIASAIFAGARAGDPYRYFKEKTITTFFSASLLLAIGWLCRRMRQLRHVAPARNFWKPETAIWGIMALGFGYLALDELVQIHESIDKLAHQLFRIKESNFTDRLDDAIVCLYGIAGIAAIFVYRKELVHHRHALPFVIAGFALFFIMVGLDFLTSRIELLRALFKTRLTGTIVTTFAIAEESCKLYAGACFFLGFYRVVYKAKLLKSTPRTAVVGGAEHSPVN